MVYQHYTDSITLPNYTNPTHVPTHPLDPDEDNLDESAPSVRKLVRVDGSATLSAICDDDDDDDDDDQFGIDGAEQVDEEEAVQVRSFGRSFGQVRLASTPQPQQKLPFRSKHRFDPPITSTPLHPWQKDSALCIGSACDSADLETNDIHTEDDSTPLDTTLQIQMSDHSLNQQQIPDRSCVANEPKPSVRYLRNVPDIDEDAENWPGVSCSAEICAAEKRKSRLLLPFSRRSSAVGSSRNGDNRSTTTTETGGIVSALMCFPSRRATFRTPCLTRDRHRDAEAIINGADAKCNTRFARGSTARPNQCHTCRPGLQCSSSRDTPLVRCSLTTTTDCQSGKHSLKNSDSQIENNDTGQKKLVKNVSLQRDDWIEFTTSSNSGPRKAAWIVRLLSSGPLDMTASRSRFDQEIEDDDEDDYEYMRNETQKEGALSRINGHVRPSTSNYFSDSAGNGEIEEAVSVSSRRSGRRFWRLWPRRT